MKHIEKIIINNARRLGENIQIDFGAGATILLAPNGTGKTTIFEAVELALTGGIKRIENFPDAIIRDGLFEMDVRLDFAEGKYCKVNYARGGVCTKQGDYKELFGIENNESLRYLFRLTHYLEQHGKEWLVEQDDKDAGNLISKLPLGKDLQQIISKKTSLLRAIGITETSAKNALNEAKKEFSDFEALVAKRDALAIVTKLTPFKEIVAKLLPISKLAGYEEYDDEYNLTLINTYSEKIRVSLKQEKDKNKDLLIRLSALKERALLYVLNLQSLSHRQIVISEHSKKISELSPIVEQTKQETQDDMNLLSNIKDEINQLNSVKSKFEEAEKKREHLVIITTKLEHNEKVIDQLNKSYAVTIEYLKNNERIRDQHKLAYEAILKKENELTSAKHLK